MKIQSVIDAFENEFTAHKHKFELIDLKGDEIRGSQDHRVARAGVYVFFKDKTVLKVGKSLSNARKRALEHFRDNTGKIMKDLDGNKDLHLLLFTVNKRENEHWVIALEDLYEWKLKPFIRSDRRC